MTVRLVTFSLLVSLTVILTPASAATQYVTDRILLGIHQEPSEDSPLIKSIPSGEKVETLETSGAFTRVQLEDGTAGWVTTSFLKNDKPATLELDELFTKFQKSEEAAKAMDEQLSKLERTLQVRRDQISNANTTIKELKKKLSAAAGGGEAFNQELEKQLEATKKELETANTKLTELEEKLQNIDQINKGDAVEQLKVSQSENSNLKARIESALANLQGKTVPSAEELAAIRPHFPVWYWGLLILILIIGGVAGSLVMDYVNRKRHGGFRI